MLDVRNKFTKDDGSYYFICARCHIELDMEDDAETDMGLIEEFENVYNLPFSELSADEKEFICDDCFHIMMRTN